MTRPLVLLDVDGVLNPYGASRRQVDQHLMPLPYYVRRILGYRVFLSKAHGPMLTAFAAEHGAELVWATTWEHNANTRIGPVIGLPVLPVIEFGGHPGTVKGWKFPAVAKYAAGRPLVWFDDDFEVQEKARILSDWGLARGDRPTLLHHVSPQVGLTEADLTVAGEWLRALPVPTTESGANHA